MHEDVEEAPTSGLYVPRLQLVHVNFPLMFVYFPVWHDTQVDTVLAPSVPLDVPAGHNDLHVESPISDEKDPSTQGVHGERPPTPNSPGPHTVTMGLAVEPVPIISKGRRDVSAPVALE